MGNRTMTVIAILLAIVVAAVAFIAALRSGTFKLTLDQLRSAYERPASQFVNIDGVGLHFEDHGSGPVLVLPHESFSSLRTWDPLVEQLNSLAAHRVAICGAVCRGELGRARGGSEGNGRTRTQHVPAGKK